MEANGGVAPLMKADTQQIAKYQELYSKVREFVEQTERDNFCLREICDAVEESDRLLHPKSQQEWGHVDPRLVLLDAKILNDATKAYKITAEALDVKSRKFDTVDFVDNILSHVSGGWASLEPLAETCYLPAAPPLSYMYGALKFTENEAKQKTRKAGRAAGTVAGKAVEPTKVITFDTEDVGIQAILERMTRVLLRRYRSSGERPVLYYKFVTDPHSFARTVQNMFHVAFLIRDGLAALDEDKRGLPVLTPITKSTKSKKGAGNSGKTVQLAACITVPQWEKVIKTFKIKEPMLVWPEDNERKSRRS